MLTGSYAGDFMQRKSHSRSSSPGTPFAQPDVHARLHDRGSYVCYLEQQLDRMTQATQKVEAYQTVLDQLHDQANTCDDKVLNLTKLVKLTQSLGDEREAEVQSEFRSMRLKSKKLDQSVTRLMADVQSTVTQHEELRQELSCELESQLETERKNNALQAEALAKVTTQLAQQRAETEELRSMFLSYRKDTDQKLQENASSIQYQMKQQQERLLQSMEVVKQSTSHTEAEAVRQGEVHKMELDRLRHLLTACQDECRATAKECYDKVESVENTMRLLQKSCSPAATEMLVKKECKDLVEDLNTLKDKVELQLSGTIDSRIREFKLVVENLQRDVPLIQQQLEGRIADMGSSLKRTATTNQETVDATIKSLGSRIDTVQTMSNELLKGLENDLEELRVEQDEYRETMKAQLLTAVSQQTERYSTQLSEHSDVIMGNVRSSLQAVKEEFHSIVASSVANEVQVHLAPSANQDLTAKIEERQKNVQRQVDSLADLNKSTAECVAQLNLRVDRMQNSSTSFEAQFSRTVCDQITKITERLDGLEIKQAKDSDTMAYVASLQKSLQRLEGSMKSVQSCMGSDGDSNVTNPVEALAQKVAHMEAEHTKVHTSINEYMSTYKQHIQNQTEKGEETCLAMKQLLDVSEASRSVIMSEVENLKSWTARNLSRVKRKLETQHNDIKTLKENTHGLKREIDSNKKTGKALTALLGQKTEEANILNDILDNEIQTLSHQNWHARQELCRDVPWSASLDMPPMPNPTPQHTIPAPEIHTAPPMDYHTASIPNKPPACPQPTQSRQAKEKERVQGEGIGHKIGVGMVPSLSRSSEPSPGPHSSQCSASPSQREEELTRLQLRDPQPEHEPAIPPQSMAKLQDAHASMQAQLNELHWRSSAAHAAVMESMSIPHEAQGSVDHAHAHVVPSMAPMHANRAEDSDGSDVSAPPVGHPDAMKELTMVMTQPPHVHTHTYTTTSHTETEEYMDASIQRTFQSRKDRINQLYKELALLEDYKD